MIFISLQTLGSHFWRLKRLLFSNFLKEEGVGGVLHTWLYFGAVKRLILFKQCRSPNITDNSVMVGEPSRLDSCCYSVNHMWNFKNLFRFLLKIKGYFTMWRNWMMWHKALLIAHNLLPLGCLKYKHFCYSLIVENGVVEVLSLSCEDEYCVFFPSPPLEDT